MCTWTRNTAGRLPEQCSKLDYTFKSASYGGIPALCSASVSNLKWEGSVCLISFSRPYSYRLFGALSWCECTHAMFRFLHKMVEEGLLEPTDSKDAYQVSHIFALSIFQLCRPQGLPQPVCISSSCLLVMSSSMCVSAQIQNQCPMLTSEQVCMLSCNARGDLCACLLRCMVSTIAGIFSPDSLTLQHTHGDRVIHKHAIDDSCRSDNGRDYGHMHVLGVSFSLHAGGATASCSASSTTSSRHV